MDYQNMNKSEIYTVQGMFIKNELIGLDFIIPCMTYGSARDIIEYKYGWFNIIWEPDVNSWVIFQYLIE